MTEEKNENFLKSIVDVFGFLLVSLFYILQGIVKVLIPNSYKPIKDVKGEIVLITGGGGGLGRLVAMRLARLKAIIVIWDVNEKGKLIIFLKYKVLKCLL